MSAVCIDLDGTLTDPELGITRCIRHALSELGREVPDDIDLKWCIGPPLLGWLRPVPINCATDRTRSRR